MNTRLNLGFSPRGSHFFAALRYAHHFVMQEHRLRQGLRGIPANCGVCAPDWLGYARAQIAFARALPGLPLP